MRWLEIDLASFAVQQSGFGIKKVGPKSLYYSPGHEAVTDIQDLREMEYGQLVTVDPVNRVVEFARDYLGHYSLSYAVTSSRLYISDDYVRLCEAVRVEGLSLNISEEAVALYLTMGFVPHGRSIYREIVNCEATGYYSWRNGKVERVNLFQPVEISGSDSVEPIGMAIEREIARYASQSGQIDVWCSGGLDSSIMAMRFNANGRQADVLSLGYGEDVHSQYGDGERRFVRVVADAAHARMRDVALTPHKFEQAHEMFTRQHNAPIMDYPLSPKYALAEATRDMAITGEGGDNLFGGTKNALMVYTSHLQPQADLGRMYANAHARCFKLMPQMLKRGQALQEYAAEHCRKLVNAYPGTLQRKLFYLNTHEKLGSMIFGQSYIPSQLYNVRVRHPFASLGVYRAAFSTPDHRKFDFPRSKIALTELYGKELPEVIIQRKKSGTQLPLLHYLEHFDPRKFKFDQLHATGLFNEQFLEKFAAPEAWKHIQPLAVHALVTLNLWLKQKENLNETLSAARNRHEQSAVAVPLQ